MDGWMDGWGNDRTVVMDVMRLMKDWPGVSLDRYFSPCLKGPHNKHFHISLLPGIDVQGDP
jgi:hypothetical protein